MPKPLEAHTVPELRAKAKARGIKTTGMRKAELVRALRREKKTKVGAAAKKTYAGEIAGGTLGGLALLGGGYLYKRRRNNQQAPSIQPDTQRNSLATQRNSPRQTFPEDQRLTHFILHDDGGTLQLVPSG